MNQPIKYLKIIEEIIFLYQKELVKFLKKAQAQTLNDFKKSFNPLFNKLKQTEISKSIQDKISRVCEKMSQFLDLSNRNSKTNHENRYNLKSQAGQRNFRLTGNLKRSYEHDTPIEQENELSEIIQSYKIENQFGPRTRMKWRSAHQQLDRPGQSRGNSTLIGHNNIDLLSYTIPQIENSIRRLSFQKSPKSVKQRETDVYRTLQSRQAKKKYIAQLF